mgnify:FL=1|tara:strand:+ start:76 stop:480 length:405 start_codon:yes stop_codon:yes gene_type:complete
MTKLDVWLLVSLVLSLLINGFLFWYLRSLLKKFLFISQNLGDLVEVVENYYEHLKHVNNMETYNGDETIEYLLRHTQSLIDVMEDYRDVYDISIPLEENQEDANNEPETKTETPPEVAVSEENVFYAGTRRRDS